MKNKSTKAFNFKDYIVEKCIDLFKVVAVEGGPGAVVLIWGFVNAILAAALLLITFMPFAILFGGRVGLMVWAFGGLIPLGIVNLIIILVLIYKGIKILVRLIHENFLDWRKHKIEESNRVVKSRREG